MRGCHKPPLDLIRFMAKTGFITHDLWQRHFCTAQSSSWMRRLKKDFIRRGYLKPHPSRYYQNVYLLNTGSDVIRSIKLDPASPPPIAQVEHDETLADGILSLERSGLMSFWQTESELKKLGANDYRIETQGQFIKYPDLLIYTREPLPDCILAVELERTLKSRRRYIQLLGAYASMKRISGLLYVVENPSIERTIREIMQETYFPIERLPVTFASEGDWLRNSPVVLSQTAALALRQLKKSS